MGGRREGGRQDDVISEVLLLLALRHPTKHSMNETCTFPFFTTKEARTRRRTSKPTNLALSLLLWCVWEGRQGGGKRGRKEGEIAALALRVGQTCVWRIRTRFWENRCSLLCGEAKKGPYPDKLWIWPASFTATTKPTPTPTHHPTTQTPVHNASYVPHPRLYAGGPAPCALFQKRGAGQSKTSQGPRGNSCTIPRLHPTPTPHPHTPHPTTSGSPAAQARSKESWWPATF